jgi:hypothetical protein
MNPRNITTEAELVEPSESLPSGHCAVKLIVRNCDEIKPGDTLLVVPFITEQEDGE